MTASEILDICRHALAQWRRQDAPDSLNKRELAELLLVSERTLTDWQGKGMPVATSAGRGASNAYAVLDVLAWVLDYARSAMRESAKERLDRLRGDQIERELLKEDGVLVHPDDIGGEYLAMVDAARAELLFNIPDALAMELGTVLGTDVDVSIIRQHIEDALSTLTQYDPGDDEDPGDSTGDEDSAGEECETVDP